MPRYTHGAFAALVCSLLVNAAIAQAVPPASAPASSTAALPSKGKLVAQSTLAACFRRPPPYPNEAQRLDLQGRTLVVFTVTSEGLPEAPRLMRSSGHAILDNAALVHMVSCIQQFTPAESAPLPAGQYALPMEWRLE